MTGKKTGGFFCAARKKTAALSAVILMLGLFLPGCAAGVGKTGAAPAKAGVTDTGETQAGETEAGDTKAAEKVSQQQKRIIYHNNSGIYEYLPETGESDRITTVTTDTYDRMENEYAGGNLSDSVRFSSDGTYALCLKDYKTSSMFSRSASLYCIDISVPEAKRRDTLIAENVYAFDITANDRVIYLDGDGKLYLKNISVGKAGTSPVQLGSDVTDYYISKDKRRAFWYNGYAEAYAMNFTDGSEKKKVAEAVSYVQFVSDDLNTVYYTNATQDFLTLQNLNKVTIVDTDISDFAVIKSTGHAYYLKLPVQAEEGDTGESDSTGEESAAAVKETSAAAKETTEAAKETSEAAKETTAVAKETTASAKETTEAAKETTEEMPLLESNAEGLGEAGNAEKTDAAGKGVTGSLGYFDGTSHTIIADGISAISKANSEDVDHDRILAEAGPDQQFKIYLTDEEKVMDTGLNFDDKSLVDVSPDYSEDVLYYIQQSGDDVGSISKGTLYRKSYTKADGFTGSPEKVCDNAVTIPAAKFGNVFTVSYNKADMTTSLSMNGKLLNKHVSSFFWDDKKKSGDVVLFCDVYQDGSYTAGKIMDVPESGETRELVYNVSVWNSFDDGTYTFLTNFDSTEGKGTLVYWNGTSDSPVTIASGVSGTTTGDGSSRQRQNQHQ